MHKLDMVKQRDGRFFFEFGGFFWNLSLIYSLKLSNSEDFANAREASSWSNHAIP